MRVKALRLIFYLVQVLPDTVSIFTIALSLVSTSYAVVITKQHVPLQFICFDFAFAKGTISLGESIVDATKNGAFSLVGGGDSVAAAKQFGFTDGVSYVSTGGGAMLESLEGKTLPGIAAVLK